MELRLAENIRAYRKARRLTQEQFAETLGVTAGAVYKWEAGLSVPELSMIVEMADFFDVSVDALLGYEIKDNRLESTKKRLYALLRSGDGDAPTEAEKALKKYPHSFDIVLCCADVYLILGMERHDKEMLRRALELLEQALLLIAQNTDPSVSEYTIYGEMGDAWIALGEYEKGLELLKKHNMRGIFSDAIGTALAVELRRPEEAEPFLGEAVLRSVSTLVNTAIGFAFLYSLRSEYTREREIVLWAQTLLRGLQAADTPCFFDKTNALLLTLLAHARLRSGEGGAACAALEEAAGLVLRFDAAPNFNPGAVRFFEIPESASVYDNLGVTARDSVESLIRLLEDRELETLWKEVADHV